MEQESYKSDKLLYKKVVKKLSYQNLALVICGLAEEKCVHMCMVFLLFLNV